MFDVGLSELIVIGIVALVVIGPERLPRVARTAGHLLGRLQRYVAGVKADLAREMELEDLRRFRSEIEDTARSVRDTVRQEMSAAEAEIRAASSQLEQDAGSGSPQPAQAGAADKSPQLELGLAADQTTDQRTPAR